MESRSATAREVNSLSEINSFDFTAWSRRVTATLPDSRSRGPISTRSGTPFLIHSQFFTPPPRISPTHVVIVPITPKEETCAAVLAAADNLANELRRLTYSGVPLEVEVDRRDLGGGVKN